MLKKIAFTSLIFLVGGQAFAADLTAAEKAALDRRVAGERGYHEATVPYFAAPPSYYRKRVTTRTCIDDGDGVTCSYHRFSAD